MITIKTKRRLIVGYCAAAVGLALAATPALAQNTKSYHVAMTAAQEVPANDSKGTGTADFTLDVNTYQLKWTITTANMSAEPLAAHIHGPAAPGSNAGVVVNLAPNGMSNPLIGTATLTAAQAADFTAGKDYVNVHTSKNPTGEIRGQIVPAAQ